MVENEISSIKVPLKAGISKECLNVSKENFNRNTTCSFLQFSNQWWFGLGFFYVLVGMVLQCFRNAHLSHCDKENCNNFTSCSRALHQVQLVKLIQFFIFST